MSISGEFIRLDALMKFASITSSGGEAKQMIQDGDVFVDGEQCAMRGKKIRPGSLVRCGHGESPLSLIICGGKPGKNSYEEK